MRRLGPEEHLELKAVAHGLEPGVSGDPVDARARSRGTSRARSFPRAGASLFDSVPGGSMIAVQIRPAHRSQLINTFDRRFKEALANPGATTSATS